jgi:hypothetical protein
LVSMGSCALAQDPAIAVLPHPSRVAVISTADTADLAALVITELSGNPEISLVERDDLAKIGDELKLQQLAGSDAVAFGRLVGADGLLFLNKGADGIQIRFTAVGLGYALFDDQATPETDLPQLAKSLAHRVAGYAPQLKLDPAHAIPISVLNLRADYATADSTALERKLTLLLESRLASLPEYVVLERRHAWSLGFEHSLATTPKPLLHGVYVVDGALSLPAQGTNEITIHLRLRSPNNQLTPLEIHGPMDDLHILVEQMSSEIQKVTGADSTAPPWQPQKEARQYLLEGIWASNHGTCEETIEALDSAELLGESAPDLPATRIPELCLMAVSSLDPVPYGITPRTTANPSPDERIEFLTRAIDDLNRYRKDNLESKLIMIDPVRSGLGRTASLNEIVSQAASGVLVMLERTQNVRADEVRSAVRLLANYDPLHGKIPWGMALDYADDWSVSKDEEIAYYRAVFEKFPLPGQAFPMYYPLSKALSADRFCARFLPTQDERNTASLKFLQDLLSDPTAKSSALFYLMQRADSAHQSSACQAFYDEIGTEREDLLGTNRLGDFLNMAFWDEKNRNVPVADPKLIALLHYYLQQDTRFSNAMVNVWQPGLFPVNEAPSLWNDWQAYGKKAIAAGRGGYIDSLNRMYTDRFGNPDGQPTTGPCLVVHRFWYPWLSPDWPRGTFTIELTEADEEGLWLSGWGSYERRGLFKINLPDFTTKVIAPPDNRFLQTLKRTPDALYATYHLTKAGQAGDPRIARLDLKTLTWSERPLPNYFSCSLFSLENTLYLFLNVQFAGNEATIARYDWDKEKFTILASSRRVPPQNQFDDTENYVIAGIFAGPEDKPCLTCYGWGPQGTFYIRVGAGLWPRVFDGGWADQTLTVFDRTLVFNRNGEATLFDPKNAGPEYWMAPREPHVRQQASKGKPPVKEQTPWLAHTLWDAPDKEVFVAPGYVGFHGDDLFILIPPKDTNGKYEMLCYQKGMGRLPRHIPLQFHLDDAARADLSKTTGDSIRDLNISKIEHPNTIQGGGSKLMTTNQGLCLQLPFLGFWFLPYGDIDQYLKANPQ